MVCVDLKNLQEKFDETNKDLIETEGWFKNILNNLKNIENFLFFILFCMNKIKYFLCNTFTKKDKITDTNKIFICHGYSRII